MFPFDPPANIRKPNISYPLIRTRTCAYQGEDMLGFLMFSRGSKGNIGKKRVKEDKQVSRPMENDCHR